MVQSLVFWFWVVWLFVTNRTVCFVLGCNLDSFNACGRCGLGAE